MMEDNRLNQSLIWATGYVSRYLVSYFISNNTIQYFEFQKPIENFDMNADYAIILSTDGFETQKFDLLTLEITHSYPRISGKGYGHLYVANFAYDQTSPVFVFRTAERNVPVYDLSGPDEIFRREFLIDPSGTFGITYIKASHFLATNTNSQLIVINMASGQLNSTGLDGLFVSNLILQGKEYLNTNN